jgi:hypothetical protein
MNIDKLVSDLLFIKQNYDKTDIDLKLISNKQSTIIDIKDYAVDSNGSVLLTDFKIVSK